MGESPGKSREIDETSQCMFFTLSETTASGLQEGWYIRDLSTQAGGIPPNKSKPCVNACGKAVQLKKSFHLDKVKEGNNQPTLPQWLVVLHPKKLT